MYKNKADKAGTLFTFIVFFVSVLLFLSVLGTAQGYENFEGKENIEDSKAAIDDLPEDKRSGANDLYEAEGPDVPMWEVGTYWTYNNYVWSNGSQEEDGSVYFKEELTYTVESIEYIDRGEKRYLGYNISREGNILDGKVETDQKNFDINGGYIEGYNFLRMSDLALVEGRLFRHYEGVGEGVVNPELNGWSYMNQSYRPPMENYDFPVNVDDLFWSNTTIKNWGYNRVKVNDNVNENTTDEEISSLNENDVRGKETIQVPGGEFETYHIHNTVTGDKDGTKEKWYSPAIGRPVREVSQLEDGDMVRKLTDYEILETSNELSIEPSEAGVGDEVTLSGQFPEHPNEDITISIPEGADSESEWQTTTDENGDFEKVIVVPMIDDVSETPDKSSSVGVVAQIEIDGQEDEYAVSTLSVYQDNSPRSP